MTVRFKVLKHSVLGTRTGLEWQKDHAGPMPWQNALDYASSLRLGKHSDWRLPTVEELITLIDFSKEDPASSFPGMPKDYFWSSSSYSGSSSYAWYVNFNSGSVGYGGKAFSYVVRCVRRGPWTPGPSGSRE